MKAEPIVPIRTYSLVFVALLILAALTTGVASIDLGVFNTVIALAIATTKMLLVALFFMHLRYKPGLSRVACIIGLFWLALLVSLSLADTFTRHWTPQGKPW
ncbi:MAG TPA: cytochrome C oxidase subunit IV family protein [Terriglobales bacterium]|nr:cytochrome C oxidase subunit IV family protein [Terriglobales bacterium]